MLAHLLNEAVTLVLYCLVEQPSCLAGIAEVAVTAQVYLVEHPLDCRLHLVADKELAGD